MLLIYGSTGYTGALIAEEAARRKVPCVLAGRSAEKLRPLAERLGLPFRAFELSAPRLEGVRAVLHCAGPFSATSRPMVDACLAARVHYLDITGEVQVFEDVLARDAEAKVRSVVLLPGTGFDVVPSDCLAKLLAEALPGAETLSLAFASNGGSSPGTLKSSIEGAAQGGRVRRAGKLVAVPAAHEVRTIPFARKPRLAMAIPWGDLATAFRSTGIPDITVYMAAPPSLIRLARLTRLAAPLLGLAPVQRLLKSRVEKSVRGPSAEARARSRAELWGEATKGAQRVEAALEIPEGYTFTADAAVTCAQRVLAGEVQPGAWTPSLAFGARFVTTLHGVTLRGPAAAAAQAPQAPPPETRA